MHIEPIFKPYLYSFRYENTDDNEYSRIFDCWSDVEYVRNFVREHKDDSPRNTNRAINRIMDEADDLQDSIYYACKENSLNLNGIFTPLRDQEFGKVVLSKQKGKRSNLRIYAIKIDDHCFVITGGAIKTSQTMQEKSHTEQEFYKINRCRDFLKDMGVFNDDSFYEMLNEL